MDDDAILAGVPDNVEPMGDDEMVMEAADDEAERAAARARQMAAEAEEDEREAARARQMAAEAEDDEAIMAEEEAEAGTAMPKKIGKRKIIKYAVDPSMLTGGTGGGVPELDEAEMERRRARAEKFGMPMPGAEGAPAAPVHVQHEMLTLEEIAKREERAKKFAIEGVDSGPTQFQKDPLASIMSLAGGNAYWEKRRDAKEDETVRPEAIHVFGTDRLSTEDLLLYFIEPNVTPEDQAPRWVEWVNDSSANVVFGTPEACGGAALAKTVPLMPNAQGIDTQSWRTMPDSQAGKGLQLLFRIATVLDVKPAKRQASRWYGEGGGEGQQTQLGRQDGRCAGPPRSAKVWVRPVRPFWWWRSDKGDARGGEGAGDRGSGAVERKEVVGRDDEHARGGGSWAGGGDPAREWADLGRHGLIVKVWEGRGHEYYDVGRYGRRGECGCRVRA